ncbi:MAG: poly-gamma-glutamate system protein, partial [candidate division WOR-3 bacterium]
MKRRVGKVSQWELILLAVVAIGLFALVVNSQQTTRARDYEARAQAAALAQSAFRTIRDYRLKTGYAPDAINDPNQTGLVGHQYSLITTGRGDQTGVLTSANPNFAAVVVAQFRRAGLRPKDLVAVGFDGSNPPLNVEVLAACSVLKLTPVIVTAVGSGAWGANDASFTWLDIEALLCQEGLLPYRSLAASIGGDDDQGRGLSPPGRIVAESAIARNRVRLLRASNLDEAVRARMALYQEAAGGHRYRAFINVGDAPVNIGDDGRPIPTGVVTRSPERMPAKSVARAMAEQGARVVNFRDILRLAYRYRLPVAPVPIPPLAKGRMFTERRYSVPLAALAALVIVV